MSIKRTFVVETEDTQLPNKEINEINIAVDLTEATLKHTIEAEYNRIYRELNELNLVKTISPESITIEAVEMDITEIYSRLNYLRDSLQQLESTIAKSKQGDNK